MNDGKDALLTSLAHMQDRLWDVDSLNFERCTLHVPFAYIVWSSRGYEQVEKVPLGNAPADWLAELASKSSQLGGNPSAVVMVGMGTMLALSGNARDAQTLMSISAGLMPTEVEGAESCLISHMKTAAGSLPDRVMGAPVRSDGTLGPLLDSGFDSPIVEGIQ